MEKRVVFRSAWLPYALVAPQIAITVFLQRGIGAIGKPVERWRLLGLAAS